MTISASANPLSSPADALALDGCASFFTRHVIEVLDEFGMKGWELAREIGISPASLATPEGRIDKDKVLALWELAVARSGNEALGLQVAGAIRLDRLSLLGYSLMLGPTLGEAFRRGARDLHFISDVVRIRTETEGAFTSFVLELSIDAATAHAAADHALGAIVAMARRLVTDENLTVVQVEMTRPLPRDRTPFDAFYRCPIRYGAAENRLVFRNANLLLPVSTAHAELAQIYDHFVQTRYPESRTGSVRADVQRQLTAMLPSGIPDVDTLAGLLGVSARTLHRRLATEETSFRDLLEATRKTLAAEYMEQGRPLKQVAAHLGFTEPANFNRAFKRWYGVSPGQYRKNREEMAGC